MKKIAIVTGASSGMGREFSMLISENIKSIDEIWLIARRRERLEELKEKIKIPCRIIDMDITTEEFSLKLEEMLLADSLSIKILVNAAGYGLAGCVGNHIRKDEVGMLDTNCTSLTNIILISLPYMAENSRIINLASSAAFFPQTGFAIYAASKAYVLNFSRALNAEIKNRKIYVTAVCPGPVDTEFFNIAEKDAKRAWYKKFFMSDAHKVVKKALKDSINKKEVSVYGASMKLLRVISKIVPDTVILKIMEIIGE